MSITKKFLKGKPVCKVTFKADKALIGEAATVAVVGEFNDWNAADANMKAAKTGDFSLTLDLEAGRTYSFRYLVDGTNWVNDPEADTFAPSEYGSENAILAL